ncbi:MAG: zinc ABC transporter solute-binding protein [Anaerolineales bacterium]|nr:zinc ABC transporter solute-binding protein [Anaerolineales bacterium]
MIRKVIFFSIGAALLLAACSQPAARAESEDLSVRPIRVVATIGMITDIVENVGGERVDVTGLMGPGVDPHLYAASEGDVVRLEGADVIFYNGLHLEAQMANVLERMAEAGSRTVPVTEGIAQDLLLSPPEFEGAFDPHVWFDVTLWMSAVEVVRDTLIEMDPSSAETYIENTETYLEELKQLHEYVTSRTQSVDPDGRVLVTAHDAFNYFGRAYDFQVRGLQGISTATEASIADIQDLADFIVERGIPAIFVESSVPQRTVEAVQAAVEARGYSLKIGGELFSDAMGSAGTPEGTYNGMVRHNVDTIMEALLNE